MALGSGSDWDLHLEDGDSFDGEISGVASSPEWLKFTCFKICFCFSGFLCRMLLIFPNGLGALLVCLCNILAFSFWSTSLCTRDSCPVLEMGLSSSFCWRHFDILPSVDWEVPNFGLLCENLHFPRIFWIFDCLKLTFLTWVSEASVMHMVLFSFSSLIGISFTYFIGLAADAQLRFSLSFSLILFVCGGFLRLESLCTSGTCIKEAECWHSASNSHSFPLSAVFVSFLHFISFWLALETAGLFCLW